MKARDIKKLKRAEQHRAMKQRDIRLEKSVEMALSGCTDRVLRAVTAPGVRSKPEPGAGSICMGDVAIYSAGFRKNTDSVTAR